MKKGIVVLSLFDGMSCGRIALERAEIKVDKYYASEIDKYAQIVSERNYPDIIRLGDITKWREWKIKKPDLIIGGSPCQGFSFAGKGLNFNDPRSALFFEFVNILKHYKPKYFLLENVKMKKEYQNVISKLLGVEPIEINSALVSAQNRRRLYWTNIPCVTRPKDKKLFLKDVLESGGIGAINQKGEITKRDKAQCIDANYAKGLDNHGQRTVVVRETFYKVRPARIYKDKAPTIRGTRFGLEVKCGRIVGRNPENPKSRKNGLPTKQLLELRLDDKTGTLSTVQKDNVLVLDKAMWRKLTPVECERLQTVPDNFTAHVSNSQRYKMLGNGWTVDVIAHIFRGLK